MPTSNETRVRVDDFENISAQVWPASGLRSTPRPFAFEHNRVAQDFFQIRAPAIFPMTINFSCLEILGIFRPKKIL